MKTKRVFIILSLFVSLVSTAQSNWIIIETELAGEYVNLKDAFPIVDEQTGNTAFFLREKKQMIGYLYDDNQKLISKVVIDDLPKKSKSIVGHSIKDGNYALFFKNNAGSKFGCLKVNFNSKNFNLTKDLDIDFNREQYIECFSDNERFYILTSVEKSSQLNLYTLDNDSNLSKKEISIPENGIKTDNDITVDFHSVICSYGAKINKIDAGEPLALEAVTAPTKIYFKDNKITLTNNFFGKRTYVIDIDVINGSSEFNVVENNGFVKGELKSGINSFILGKYYLSVYSTNQKLVFSIYDYPSFKPIKAYRVEKHETIDFKNTKMIQKLGDSEYGERILDKTSKFLRKVSNSHLGIVAYKSDDNYVITIGSSQLATNELSIISFMLGGIVGGVLYHSFTGYNQTKSIQIQCLFNSNFDHDTSAIPENGFDRINTFIKDFKRLHVQSVFKYKGNYVWGSFNKNSGFYRLYIFDN